MEDAYDQWRYREIRQQAWLDARPECAECEQPIQDDRCFEFDGALICKQCLEDYHLRWTEDFCG